MGKYDYTEGPLSVGNQVCKDVPFCIFFIIFKIFSLVIFYEAYQKGDVHRLMMPTDYNGDVCGQNGSAVANKPLGYFPRLPEDMLVALSEADNCLADAATGAIGHCKVRLYAVCVASCPMAGDIVCNYDVPPAVPAGAVAVAAREVQAAARQVCWSTPIDQTVKFNRCLPTTDQRMTARTYQCCYGKAIVSQWNKTGYGVDNGGRCPNGCCFLGQDDVGERAKKSCTGKIMVKELTQYNTTAGMNGLMANLVSTEAVIERWFGDCYTVIGFILFIGVGCSIVAATGYVFIMQYIAGCLVWIIVVLIFLIWVVISTVCLFKGGSIFGVEIDSDGIMDYAAAHTSKHADQLDHASAYLGQGESEKSKLAWMYIGHGAAAFTLLYAAIVCTMSERIQLTIELIKVKVELSGFQQTNSIYHPPCRIKVTAKAIQETPGTLFIPILEWLVSFGMLFYFLVSAALILTTDWDPKADLREALTETNPDQSAFCPPSVCSPTVMNGTEALEPSKHDAADAQTLMLAYQIFGFYWGRNVLEAVTSMVVAAAVAEVFWTKAKAEKRNPTIDSLKYIFKYHLGSACYGAFVLALIEFIRTALAYVQSRTQEAQRGNPPLKALFCACQLCLCCFNRCVKYLTSNAYVMVAIDGVNFCHAAWGSFTMLLANGFRVSVAQSLSKVLGWLAVLFIASTTTFVAAFCFTNLELFQTGFVDTTQVPPVWVDRPGAYAIQSAALPSVMVFLLSMVVALSFTNVWNIGVTTVLFSFLLDEQRAKAGKYQEPDDPNFSVTKKYWPDLFEYIHAPHRDRKSDEELEQDAKALADSPPPPSCFGGDKVGDSEMALVPMAPMRGEDEA